MAVDGMGDGRALADESGAQVAAFGSVVAPGFSQAQHKRGLSRRERAAGGRSSGHGP